LEEPKRHNRIMEGHGVYFAPYKRGGVTTEKIKKIKNVKQLPKMLKDVCQTTNVQLQQLKQVKRIFHILEIFLCVLPYQGGVYRNKNDIVNLDNANGPGTH